MRTQHWSHISQWQSRWCPAAAAAVAAWVRWRSVILQPACPQHCNWAGRAICCPTVPQSWPAPARRTCTATRHPLIAPTRLHPVALQHKEWGCGVPATTPPPSHQATPVPTLHQPTVGGAPGITAAAAAGSHQHPGCERHDHSPFATAANWPNETQQARLYAQLYISLRFSSTGGTSADYPQQQELCGCCASMGAASSFGCIGKGGA